ncbi:hypothetical protein GALMADRAFT_217525 [Galerina marginata CBS 339.88]|uniref:Uncharacterized protein n=1 Tax=Galerina marginata (strain CBS 339.88) TaxID=685588 RepID=A0A067S419_GALM3|nr:hypothetical protein GALMADRAFT_217525 [Galerina marginata CBS 339.88]
MGRKYSGLERDGACTFEFWTLLGFSPHLADEILALPLGAGALFQPNGPGRVFEPTEGKEFWNENFLSNDCLTRQISYNVMMSTLTVGAGTPRHKTRSKSKWVRAYYEVFRFGTAAECEQLGDAFNALPREWSRGEVRNSMHGSTFQKSSTHKADAGQSQSLTQSSAGAGFSLNLHSAPSSECPGCPGHAAFNHMYLFQRLPHKRAVSWLRHLGKYVAQGAALLTAVHFAEIVDNLHCVPPVVRKGHPWVTQHLSGTEPPIKPLPITSQINGHSRGVLADNHYVSPLNNPRPGTSPFNIIAQRPKLFNNDASQSSKKKRRLSLSDRPSASIATTYQPPNRLVDPTAARFDTPWDLSLVHARSSVAWGREDSEPVVDQYTVMQSSEVQKYLAVMEKADQQLSPEMSSRPAEKTTRIASPYQLDVSLVEPNLMDAITQTVVSLPSRLPQAQNTALIADTSMTAFDPEGLAAEAQRRGRDEALASALSLGKTLQTVSPASNTTLTSLAQLLPRSQIHRAELWLPVRAMPDMNIVRLTDKQEERISSRHGFIKRSRIRTLG